MRRALLLLAATGCVSDVTSYPVLARAELSGAGITGPIEVLGTHDDGGDRSPFIERTVAAYRVQLPDDDPRHVLIYDQASCDEPNDTPTNPYMFPVDLGEIRRVGDAAHFFISDVDLHGQRYAIDVDIVQAPISMIADADNYVVGKLAVLRAPDGADGSLGARLACGVFVRSDTP